MIKAEFVRDHADVLWPASVEAGAQHQHRDEEGRVAARLSTERRRPMEQELPTAQPVQRNLHMDQHAARSISKPEVDSR